MNASVFYKGNAIIQQTDVQKNAKSMILSRTIKLFLTNQLYYSFSYLHSPDAISLTISFISSISHSRSCKIPA